VKLTLAIDCSMRWLNLGLADSGVLYGEENINAGRAQAELLPRSVVDFLGKLGFALNSVERIAVTTGPGYYTGIRVGLAYASALAEGLGVEVVPLSSLYAMAFPLINPGFCVSPVLKARRGYVYGAVYGLSQGFENIAPSFHEARVFADLLRSLEHGGEEVVILGSDAYEFDELKNSGIRIIPAPPSIGLSLAMASLSLPGTDPASVRATYIREPG
jgi:tRNA threonylcarbamoyladenosine biosynthesis protein TsaB